jgi:hypothetical protein
VISAADQQVVAAQLGRPPRAVHAVAHRCGCGNPDVVSTEPRLPDGTPFPTLYYLTCPIAAARIGTLEASGLMAEMTRRLAEDPALAARYHAAHQRYLQERAGLGEVPEITGISAGGMPDRVKCLHVLVAQALASGPGVNPLGDEALDRLGDWWAAGSCVPGAKATASEHRRSASDEERSERGADPVDAAKATASEHRRSASDEERSERGAEPVDAAKATASEVVS